MGIRACPKCGHVDLSDAPRLAHLYRLTGKYRSTRALADGAHVSIQIASNAAKRFRDLGLIKMRAVNRPQGGVGYEW